MLKRNLHLLLVLTFQTAFTQANAQNSHKWEFGIQAEHGRDWYHRDYYEWNDLPNGYIQNFPSYYSRGAGFNAERIIGKRFSALAQVSYLQKKMPTDMFGETSRTASQWITKEMHHRGAVDLGLRWYVNPESKLRFFADGKIGANMLVAAVQHLEGYGKVVIKDGFEYNRISPVASGSIGLKWNRLALSTEYRHDLAAVKRNRAATGIKAQGLVGKVALTLFKAR